MGWMRRRAHRAVLPEANAGPAGVGQPGHSPDGSTGGQWHANSVTGIATGALSRCAARTARMLMRGWSPRAGRWRIGGTRGRMWMRNRRRERRARGFGAESSSHPGTGDGGSACRVPPGMRVRRRETHRAAATSRGTSATTVGDASTTCPAIATTRVPKSARRGASGGSARKPKPGRPAGGERADSQSSGKHVIAGHGPWKG